MTIGDNVAISNSSVAGHINSRGQFRLHSILPSPPPCCSVSHSPPAYSSPYCPSFIIELHPPFALASLKPLLFPLVLLSCLFSFSFMIPSDIAIKQDCTLRSYSRLLSGAVCGLASLLPRQSPTPSCPYLPLFLFLHWR